MQILLSLSIAMLAGLLMSRLTKLWNLPAVTAYLVAGVLVGPYVLGRLGVPGLGFISNEDVANYSIISDAALGFIAFAMGNEFRISELKKTGKKATVIAVFQALGRYYRRRHRALRRSPNYSRQASSLLRSHPRSCRDRNGSRRDADGRQAVQG